MTDPLPLRPALCGVTPYGAPESRVAVSLNVNENPYPPSAVVVAEMAEAVGRVAARLNRYPERDAMALRADLAGYLGHGLTADRVWPGNGSNEVLTHVLQAFGGPEGCVLSFEPTYSMYPVYARSTATPWVGIPRRPDFTIDDDEAIEAIRRVQPTVTLLASPNNPTGTALPLALIERICVACKGIVVIDEAYAEFRRPGIPSALTLLDDFGNLVVARTMSKAFGMAGLRLGYLAAAPEIVAALQLVRLPYHLAATTQELARVALAHAAEMLAVVDRLREERDELVIWLRGQGFEVADSDANFVLFGRFADPHRVWEGLLAQGVLIRETPVEGWLRVSVGTPEDMVAFRSALVAVGAVRREEVRS